MAYVSAAAMTRRIRMLLNEQLTAIEIQEALDQTIRERVIGHQWSFMKDEFAFNTVAEASDGTVAITQDATTVTGTSTAFDVTNDPGRLFIGPDGEPYEISAVASTTSLTLASPYAGTTATAGTYAIRQAIYTLNSNVEQVVVVGGSEWPMYEISDVSLMTLDVDRDVTGPPWYWRYVDPDSSGNLRIELHPTPVAVQRVPYIGLLKGVVDTRDDNFWHTFQAVLVNGATELSAMMIAARQNDATQIRKWQNQAEFYGGRFAIALAELKRRDLDLFSKDAPPFGFAWAYQDDPGLDLGVFYE